MAKKWESGLSNVHVAFLDEDTGAYDEPVAIPGAVNLSLSPEGEASEFFADNIKYDSSTSNQGYTGDLEMALVSDAVKAEMLGWLTDSEGGIVEIADGVQKPFALMFEIDGNDGTNTRYCFFNCTAARPEHAHKTKEKTPSPDTHKLALTVLPITIDDESVVQRSLEYSLATATAYNAWYEAVPEPTFAVS